MELFVDYYVFASVLSYVVDSDLIITRKVLPMIIRLVVDAVDEFAIKVTNHDCYYANVPVPKPVPVFMATVNDGTTKTVIATVVTIMKPGGKVEEVIVAPAGAGAML